MLRAAAVAPSTHPSPFALAPEISVGSDSRGETGGPASGVRAVTPLPSVALVLHPGGEVALGTVVKWSQVPGEGGNSSQATTADDAVADEVLDRQLALAALRALAPDADRLQRSRDALLALDQLTRDQAEAAHIETFQRPAARAARRAFGLAVLDGCYTLLQLTIINYFQGRGDGERYASFTTYAGNGPIIAAIVCSAALSLALCLGLAKRKGALLSCALVLTAVSSILLLRLMAFVWFFVLCRVLLVSMGVQVRLMWVRADRARLALDRANAEVMRERDVLLRQIDSLAALTRLMRSPEVAALPTRALARAANAAFSAGPELRTLDADGADGGGSIAIPVAIGSVVDGSSNSNRRNRHRHMGTADGSANGWTTALFVSLPAAGSAAAAVSGRHERAGGSPSPSGRGSSRTVNVSDAVLVPRGAPARAPSHQHLSYQSHGHHGEGDGVADGDGEAGGPLSLGRAALFADTSSRQSRRSRSRGRRREEDPSSEPPAAQAAAALSEPSASGSLPAADSRRQSGRQTRREGGRQQSGEGSGEGSSLSISLSPAASPSARIAPTDSSDAAVSIAVRATMSQ